MSGAAGGDGTLDLVLCTACLDVVDFLSGVPVAVRRCLSFRHGTNGIGLVAGKVTSLFSCWLRHVLE